MQPLTDNMLTRAFDFCSVTDVKGFFMPNQISLFLNRIQNIAVWESVYVHETIHSLLSDCLTGWWIQTLDEIADNMFVVFRSGRVLDVRLVSWMFNLEYKVRKLCQSWVKTQEGFATYFQLNLADVESRASTTALELHKLGHPMVKGVDDNQIKNEVEAIEKKWKQRIKSRNCPEPYWRGYELVAEIASKFGTDNLAPVALAASSVRFPRSLVSQNIAKFNEMLSMEKFNVDKRLELISQIPKDVIRNFPLKDDWLNLTRAILKHIGEPPLDEEFDFVDFVKETYTNSDFPQEFIDISEKEMESQLPASDQRWKLLKKKGINSSQLVGVFNVTGELLTLSDFEPVYGHEIDDITALRYQSILNAYDRLEFINDLVLSALKRDKAEPWMQELIGFSGYERVIDLFSLKKLVNLKKICALCHEKLKYSNRGIICPHSNLLICMNCCTVMNCSCVEFSTKKEINLKISEIIISFSYECTRVS